MRKSSQLNAKLLQTFQIALHRVYYNKWHQVIFVQEMKLFISHGLCQLWILAYASHYTEKVIAK